MTDYELFEVKGDATTYAVVDEHGRPVWSGNLAELHRLTAVLNRFVTLGDSAGTMHSLNGGGKMVQWLSTADAVQTAADRGRRLTADAIRAAARAGKFTARHDAAGRWQYERVSFVSWLDNPEAHRPGRPKEGSDA